MAAATAALTSDSFVTSAWTNRPPRSEATFSPLPASRSRMTTVAPASESLRAVLSPIPEAPPVTIAVVFCNMAPDLTTPGMQPQLRPFTFHVAETEQFSRHV